MASSLRVSTGNTVVVPPFECAWLSSQLFNGGGLLTFSVKGQSDVTLIFRSSRGAKRWQHYELQTDSGREARQDEARDVATSSNYTVIIGSHRNSLVRVERSGQPLVARPYSIPTTGTFHPFWVNLHRGTLSIGTGTCGQNVLLTFTDPVPLRNLCHVALSAWSEHTSYRDVRLSPPMEAGHQDWEEAAPRVHGPREGTLQALCVQELESAVHVENAVEVWVMLQPLSAMLGALCAHVLRFIAANFAEVAYRPGGLAALDADAMETLLSMNQLV